MDGDRRYMAGDVVRMEMVLEHAANLSRVFVAFSHERDPLTELYFETTSFPLEDAERAPDGARRTRVALAAPIPPETVPGVYGIQRVNVFSVGGKLPRLREDGLPASSFEVVEEPTEPPTVAGLEFLAP